MNKSRYPITINKKLGFIDDSGIEVIPPTFNAPPGARVLTGFSNGVAWVFINNKYALIDTEGNVLFDCDFDNVHTFSSNGYAKVWPNSEYGKGLSSYDQKGAGLINKKGEFIIKPIYNNLFHWHDERIVFVKNGKNGVIDYQENEIIPPIYASISILDGNKTEQFYHIVENDDEMFALFSPEGKQITDFMYEDINFGFCDGLAKFEKNGLSGYLNTNLDEVIPAQFEEAQDFSCGAATVKNNEGLYGYIDQSGKQIVPFKYKEAYCFSEDLATVSEDGKKYGFINKKGEWVIPPQFEEADSFREGAAKLKQGGKIGFINTKGDFIIPLDEYAYMEHGKHSLIQFNKNGKIGFYNTAGHIIIQPQFEAYCQIKNNLIAVDDGYLDLKGNYVWKQPAIPDPEISFTTIKYLQKNDISLIVRQLEEKDLLNDFGEKLSEEQILEYEQKHNFTLPAQFRTFIKEIGNGGTGPLAGIYDLDYAFKQSFKLNEDFVPSEVSEDNTSDFKDKEGILPICDDEAEYTIGIVVSGTEAGTIWFSDCDYWMPYTPKFGELINHFSDTNNPYNTASKYLVKNQKDIPRMTFNDWYYDWLQNGD